MDSLFAIYSRVSNRYDEKTDSLHTQRDASLRFAEDRGLPVNPEWVFLEKDSGYETADERKDLLRLRELARSGQLGGIIFHNTDRLSREPIELCSLVQEFRRNEAEVHFVLTPMEDTPTGKAMLFLRGVGHEMEWLAIKERTTRIKDQIVASGRVVGEGGARYGFTWDKATRTRVADPVSSEWVRLIFRLIGDDGLSMRQAAIELNARKVPTPSEYKGKVWKDGRTLAWTSGSVRLIVVDETYLGVATARRVKRVRKNVFKKLPRSEWVTLQDGRTEALVDEALWHRANAAIKGNDVIGRRTRAASTRNEARFALLRGIITCGGCGSPLRVARSRNWNPSTRCHDGLAGHKTIYRCDSRRTMAEKGLQDARCYGKPVYEDKVRDAAWEAIVAVVSDERLIEDAISRHKADRPGEAVFRESHAAALAEAKSCDRKIANLVSSLADEDDPAIRRLIRDKIEAVRSELARHDARATQLADRLVAFDEIDHRADNLRRRTREMASALRDHPAETEARPDWGKRREFMDWLGARFSGNGDNLKLTLDLGFEIPSAGPLSVPKAHSRKRFDDGQRLSIRFPSQAG